MSKYSDLIKRYGKEKFDLKICEELSELQTAYLHYLDGKVTDNDVIEEIADVEIQIEKIAALLGEFKHDQVFEVQRRIFAIKKQKMQKLEKITYH